MCHSYSGGKPRSKISRGGAADLKGEFYAGMKDYCQTSDFFSSTEEVGIIIIRVDKVPTDLHVGLMKPVPHLPQVGSSKCGQEPFQMPGHENT